MEPLDITSTLCRFAWDYPIVTFNRNGLRNCCRAGPSDVTQSDIDQHGIDLFTKFAPVTRMKRDLLSGVRTPACNACWEQEKNGGHSARTPFPDFAKFLLSINWFPGLTQLEIEAKLRVLTTSEKDALASNLEEPRMLELSLSNVCDLKCMYCNHHYSSQWAAEKLKYKEIPLHLHASEFPKANPAFEELFWQWFEQRAYRTVRSLNFIGGEPLLIEEFYTAIERVLSIYEQKLDLPPEGITFSVVSNFNTPPKQFDRFLSHLDRIFAHPKLHLDINASVESIGARAEVIRSGCDWGLVDRNVNAFLSAVKGRTHERVTFGVIPSINALSVSSLPEFVQWVIDLRARHERSINLRINQIVFPSWLSPLILPAHYADYVDQGIRVLESSPISPQETARMSPAGRWYAYLRFLRGLAASIRVDETQKDHHARREFKTNILRLADRRGLDLSVFKEMQPFFNMIDPLP